jgi:hypothetical protein
MDLDVRAKLSVMMFLQYFVWGVWFVTMGTYLSTALKFPDDQLGWAYAASPIGAMIAPFFVGMIADRFFATQHILAVLHFMGAILLVAASQVEQFSAFFPIILLYFLCYMPTLALTNSISFRHMSSPERQFPGIRVLGTIGWIVAGLLVGALKIEDRNLPLQMGAVASGILALYCLALPHTPPANSKGHRAGCVGPGCLEPDEDHTVRRVRDRLILDLHSAAVLLRGHEFISQRDQVSQPGRHDDDRSDVRDFFHAGDAALLRAAGGQIHAAGGHVSLGSALRALCAGR